MREFLKDFLKELLVTIIICIIEILITIFMVTSVIVIFNDRSDFIMLFSIWLCIAFDLIKLKFK